MAAANQPHGHHTRLVCQYGKVHRQCRCPAPKTDVLIDCDTPDRHKPSEGVEEPMPMRRTDRGSG